MSRMAAASSLKVLLIEDSTLLRLQLGEALEELDGVEVLGGAADEETAIELLQRQPPDLAIVDLALASGSGFGVLLALAKDHERFGRVRAVVFSSHGHRAIRERCRALGVDRFFDKDSDLDDLLAYVRNAASA